MEFILEDDKGWSIRKGLRCNVELLEVKSREVGLPLEGSRRYVLLARTGTGSQEDLANAARLARWLSSLLPRSTVQELPLPDGHPHLEEVRQQAWKATGQVGGERTATGRYADHLRNLEKTREAKGDPAPQAVSGWLFDATHSMQLNVLARCTAQH